ncbi:hypothetical protein PybrP1_005425 [[Pythium] brassicae (nom. inval.)]|nr:hypothetical protein PybrP1_005425 [[Pythium] brassicae (nom. inval.)]
MNLLQGKSNQYLREAILEESLEKVKRYLTLKIGKADVGALTEVRSSLIPVCHERGFVSCAGMRVSVCVCGCVYMCAWATERLTARCVNTHAPLSQSGGFSMLHCAALTGNTQIVMMLLQCGADVMALTDDGYTALDLAIWKGHLQIIELLRSQGCIAPMKEPESLNGKVIQFMGRKATVVDFEPSTSIRTSSLRALHYEDNGEAKLVNLWAGTDYKIIGNNPYYEDVRQLLLTLSRYDDMLQGQAFFDNDSDSDDEEELIEREALVTCL